MVGLIGIAVMVMGLAIVSGARIYPERRTSLERWGADTFLGGLIVWAVAFRFI